MRTSKTHKVAMAAVVTTIATATVLTFTRSDTAAADRIASVPQAGNDAPVVAHEPAATTRPKAKPKAKPSPDAAKPTADPTTQAPKPVAKPTPTKTTTTPPPTTQPTPSPSPTPRKKGLLEILLGL